MKSGPRVLPESFLKLMRPEDRAALGPAGRTASEAQRHWQRGEERKMHEEFSSWLEHHAHELYWDHSRMDRATSNRVGHPDFVIQRSGQVLNIEMKVQGGRLSEKQAEVHAWIERAGGRVYVCRSSAEAIKITREFFAI